MSPVEIALFAIGSSSSGSHWDNIEQHLIVYQLESVLAPLREKFARSVSFHGVRELCLSDRRFIENERGVCTSKLKSNRASLGPFYIGDQHLC